MYFTICIPMYNRENTIGRTLNSLVEQSFQDFEVLVIDDGSVDNGAEVVKTFEDKLNLVYFYKNNGGKHTALNKGIALAKGLFFIICDSDDYFLPRALEKMHELCKDIEKDATVSGVMCRCVDINNNRLIGEPFPESPYMSSYIDFHFFSGQKLKYLDCCEANKTAIIKKYKFPEPLNTKFVPEAYIFDQIGIKYKLYCYNEILLVKEYLEDGITKDRTHFEKNALGYLYDYIMNLEIIFPQINVTIKTRIIMWWKYWNAYNMCSCNDKPHVKKVTLLGRIVKAFCPFINLVKSI